MSEIKVTKINVDLFKDYLGKLIAFNKNIYIKINDSKVESRLYLTQKEAVKVIELNTEDIFEFKKPLDGELRMTLGNAKEIIMALGFFTEDNTKAQISESNMDAKAFVLENDQEKFRLYCLDPNFDHLTMEDHEVKAVFETKILNEDADSQHSYFANFELDHEMLKKIDSRLKISKDESKFAFKVQDGKAYIVTKNNELVISEDIEVMEKKDKDGNLVEMPDSVVLFRKYLSLLDKENYRVFLCSNKIIFESLTSNTKLAIAASSEEDDLEDINDLNDDLSDLDDLPMDL
jgi:hypothetical protein